MKKPKNDRDSLDIDLDELEELINQMDAPLDELPEEELDLALLQDYDRPLDIERVPEPIPDMEAPTGDYMEEFDRSRLEMDPEMEERPDRFGPIKGILNRRR